MIVQAPDNKTIDFGDLPPDQVRAAMQKMYSPQMAQQEAPTVQDFPNKINQMAKGATFGLNDEAVAGVTSLRDAYDKGSLNDIGKTYNEALDLTRNTEKKYEDENPLTALGLQLVGGIGAGGAGTLTKTGASFANSLRSGNLAARTIKGAAAGAASGGAYGFGTGEGDLGQRLHNAESAAITGGAVAGAAPVAGKALSAAGDLAKQAVIPEIDSGMASLADRARQLGIPLSLNQISPTRVRKTVQKVSQELPFSGVDDFQKQQVSSFNKALAKTIGQDSEDLGPTTIQSFRIDNSNKFDTAFSGQNFSFVNTVKNDLMNIIKEARSTIDDNHVKIVDENIKEVWDQLKSGTISGEKLASIRSRLLGKMTRMKNDAAPYVGDIIDKLDDIASYQMEPEKLEQLASARREYRNFKTIHPLLEKSTDGNINPTQLINRVAANKYIDASKIPTGQDELIDLARIGKEFMPQLGGSDTFQKGIMGGGLATIGTMAMSNPLIAAALAAKAGAGLGANRLFQKGINQSQRIVDKSIESSSLSDATSKKLSSDNVPKITIRPKEYYDRMRGGQ